MWELNSNSQQGPESRTWCKGGCLHPRAAPWHCTVSPCCQTSVLLLEALREGESWAPFHQIVPAEKCYVLSVMGKSPFMAVPKAFTCNVLGRNYSSLLEFIRVLSSPGIQWEGRRGFSVLNPRWWSLGESQVPTSLCALLAQSLVGCGSRQALWHGTVGESGLRGPDQLWSFLREKQEASTSAFSLILELHLHCGHCPFAEQGFSYACGWLHSSLIHSQTADFMSCLVSCLPHHPWTCLMVWTPD